MRRSYFRSMKALFPLLLAAIALLPSRSLAQNTAAEAALERKANEERLTRLNAVVSNLSETMELLRLRNSELEQKVASLSREINKMREENAHAGTRHVTREEFNALVEKLKEVEKKREDDKKLIVESIKDLAKASGPAPSHAKPPPADRAEVKETVDYTVRKGDLLSGIVTAYNDEYAKQGLGRITLDQVKQANPDLNPNKIREGQVIRIPVPPKKP